MTRDPALQCVIERFGSVRALARACALNESTVRRWRKVPVDWAPSLADSLGMPVSAVRADLARPSPADPVVLRSGRRGPLMAVPEADAKIARAARAWRAATDVVAAHFNRPAEKVRALRGMPRQMAVYLAVTAVEHVCRVSVAEHFLITHQAVSKALATLGDQRGDDDALDALLDELSARVAAMVEGGAP
jgi:hypothetical protein